MKPRRIFFFLPILLLACSLFTGRPTATPAPPTATPAAQISPSPTSRPLPSGTATPDPALTPPEPVLDLALQEAAMLPAFAGDIQSFPDATQYAIDMRVTFDPEQFQATIEGEVRIFFTNPLDEALQDFALMLWPNEEQYESEMDAGPVTIAGQQIQPSLDAKRLVLSFPLPAPLPPGGSISMSLPFSVQASGPIGGWNPQRLGITEGVFIAPSFYPLVPRLVEGEWQTDDPPYGGDTTNSDIAYYDVRIISPAEFELAASGVEIERQENDDGTRTQRFVTGPMRDFAIAIGPLQRSTRISEDVTLIGWVLPQHADDSSRMLRAASIQMRALDRLVGPYPYPELDIVDAPEAFGGIEYPGLVYIGTVGTYWLIEPTVHEVAHQWFYALIGNDQLTEPWLDEAAASYAEVIYYEEAGSIGLATSLLDSWRAQLRDHPRSSTPIGLPVGDYETQWDYSLFVYLKGALFLEELRQQLGDDVFFDFTRSYFSAYRYGFASGTDFQQTAEQACGCDLEALFNLWVYEGGQVFLP
jgi:hypothetical protein